MDVLFCTVPLCCVFSLPKLTRCPQSSYVYPHLTFSSSAEADIDFLSLLVLYKAVQALLKQKKLDYNPNMTQSHLYSCTQKPTSHIEGYLLPVLSVISYLENLKI